jgi:hypothetical protein
MPYVELDPDLRAPHYRRPLRFTFDRSLEDSRGFRYVYEQGALRCSQKISAYSSVCKMAPHEMNAIYSGSLSFVYLDAGRWGDGNQEFGLVSGADVYLCEYVPGESWDDAHVPQCCNASVHLLLQMLWALNCGVRVVSYAQATNLAPRSVEDNHVYILFPDCHLPPISWYFPSGAVNVMPWSLYRDPPDWFCATEPFNRNKNFYRGLYGLKMSSDDFHRQRGTTISPHQSDIFGSAGAHLIRFLNALTRLPTGLASKTHFISMGDTFELWLNRDYQFVPGGDGIHPRFIAGGEDRATEYIAEVMLWNMEVIEAFRTLEKSDLAEVKFLWGNHEAYLMSSSVVSKVSLSPRASSYRGLNGDLVAEHGHRFDASNHDNIKSSDGPFFANLAYWFPSVREAEPIARDAKSLFTGAPKERDCYLLGASLVYLYQKFKQKQKPFSIFCMGHTHSKHLCTFDITGQYSIWGGSE